MFVALMCAFSFVCCSGDDDGPKTENVKSLIVGDWLYETSSEYVLYHFDSDGTGLIIGDANTLKYTKTKFVYSVDNETRIITIIPNESEKESYLILPINKHCVNLQSLTDSRNLTLNRYDGDIESEFSDENSGVDNFLYGSWSAPSGDGGNTLYFTFKGNGECTYDEVSYYNDYKIARAHFAYSYDAEDEMLVLTLKYIEDPELTFVWIMGMEEPGDKEEWEMRILSDDKFIIPHIFGNGAVFTRM